MLDEQLRQCRDELDAANQTVCPFNDVYQCPPVSLNLARIQHPGVSLSALRATDGKQFAALLSSWAHHLQ